MAAEFRSLVVSRHARVGIVGDPATATRGMVDPARIRHAGARHPALVSRCRAARIACWSRRKDCRGSTRNSAAASESVGASWVTREDLAQRTRGSVAYLERVVAEIVPDSAAAPRPRLFAGRLGRRRAGASGTATRRSHGWSAGPGAMPEDVTGRRPQAEAGRRAAAPGRGRPRHAGCRPSEVEADAARLRAAGMTVRCTGSTGGHRVDRGAAGVRSRSSQPLRRLRHYLYTPCQLTNIAARRVTPSSASRR